jgi:coenzyme Q-binding protein COQ10
MPRLALERHVPQPPAAMFDLVADLRSYPKFVPNCRAMEVRSGAHEDTRYARMTIQVGPLSDSYTSRVTLDPEAGTIAARAVDGPFSHLDSTWRFEPEGEGTCVRFEIDFNISNPLLAAVAEPLFAGKQDEIMDAFLREARRRAAAKQ